MEAVRGIASKPRIVLVGTKGDLSAERQVDTDTAKVVIIFRIMMNTDYVKYNYYYYY